MLNSGLRVQFDVLVLAGGLPPYRAYTEQAVSRQVIGRIGPGMTVQAGVLMDDPETIWLDLQDPP